jgi:hypothetical protein
MADEVKEYVTAEVANNVLAVYGNERATFPSQSVLALISLIRTCCISDDEMLDELNRVPAFHGYVLAIAVLMEGEKIEESGRQILEIRAGLRSADTGEET